LPAKTVIVVNIQEHLFVPLTFRNIISLYVFHVDDDNEVGGIMKRWEHNLHGPLYRIARGPKIL